MMDPSILLPADGLEAIHQNGVHDESSNSGNDVVSNSVDPIVNEIAETVALNGNLENFEQSGSTVSNNSSTAAIKEGPIHTVDSHNAAVSKEEEVKIMDQTMQSRAQKGHVNNKTVKPPSPRGTSSSLVKSKDGKGEEAPPAVPNGTSALGSNPRQPIKNRSFSDKQTQQKPGKLDAASSKALMEKTKPSSLKKGLPDNVKGKEDSSSPAAQDAKTRTVGVRPNYGFRFKCDERAERRKQFYTQLEEKIHAKEVEESTMQAKTKETQEAEIKMLRKTLAFKATPMPSFYQEPPPPRVELKKIPTTRAKSPKLGRRKSSTYSEPDVNTSSSVRLGRLSLDEKVSQSKPTKGVIPAHQKKPQRKSLPPRLTSEKISSSNSATSPTSSEAVGDEKTSLSEFTPLSHATEEEKVEIAAAVEENNTLSNETTSDKPSEAESHVNGDIVTEEKPDITSVPEPIPA
ncbi:hypothetical protein Lalb_Chr08g0244091 [Lupinus albus]|uniref:TPX2 C-terminal domain-containing protein n=1 Tax=Lupinus albus TaxID=3870 RepID=A0A6A4Q6S9_LUPAL|nr:hypothetical protein Lalb_Chr08g0244091 [Lupinus albus]